jgi:hypothetical protein
MLPLTAGMISVELMECISIEFFRAIIVNAG